MTDNPHPKKLIEVGLPLAAINKASSAEKSVRHGHPSTMHLWWARRPLASCRAVIFAQLVDDPSSHPELFPTEEEQNAERERLFGIIEALVPWKNVTNERILTEARAEIEASMGSLNFTVLDPFSGGGSIPLEAQRLGLAARGSDLDPIPVILGSCLIDFPARFSKAPAVHPQDGFGSASTGPAGLASDIRYYGAWMREQAFERIGSEFPSVTNATNDRMVVAWIWARSVECPNPACRYQVPLVRSFVMAKRANGPEWWVEPVPHPATKAIRFVVHSGMLTAARRKQLSTGTSAVTPGGKAVRATFICPACTAGTVKGEYVDALAAVGKLTYTPVAAVVETAGRKEYVSPANAVGFDWSGSLRATESKAIERFIPTEPCRGTFASNAMGRRYGFHTFADYFTPRGQLAMSTFLGLVDDVVEKVSEDGAKAGVQVEDTPLAQGGRGNRAYAETVATYLALAASRCADYWSTLATWAYDGEFVRDTFTVPGIPMAWDFAEVNPFSDSSGNWMGSVDWLARVVEKLPVREPGIVEQHDAMRPHEVEGRVVVCTDPPYYDNVSYAVLADYFYVWLRRGLRSIFPAVFSTLLTPKEAEIVATDFLVREGVGSNETFFRDGLREAFARIREIQDPDIPFTVFYAYNDADAASEGAAGGAVGWETMLTGLLDAGFGVVGTWPLRTERQARSVAIGANALASSILLVCRPRPQNLRTTTRQEFIGELRREIPGALAHLQSTHIAAVDLAQAVIGPGMAVFSTFERVLKPDGTPLTVGEALAAIDSVVGDLLDEATPDADPDTRWALSWYDQHGFASGSFDEAQGLARPKGTTVDGLERSGIVVAQGGRVRLKTRDELPEEYSPASDSRATLWEATQHLVKAHMTGGDLSAAELLARLGASEAAARDLSYRLFEMCRRRGREEEALPYNSLVASWAEIARLARRHADSARLPGMN